MVPWYWVMVIGMVMLFVGSNLGVLLMCLLNSKPEVPPDRQDPPCLWWALRECPCNTIPEDNRRARDS